MQRLCHLKIYNRDQQTPDTKKRHIKRRFFEGLFKGLATLHVGQRDGCLQLHRHNTCHDTRHTNHALLT